MKILKKISGVAAALPLMAACSAYDLNAINNQEIASWPFAESLHGQYMRLAYEEAGEQDWDDAMFFAGKAQVAADAANEGAFLPDPQMVEDRQIPEDSRIVLNVARDDLMEALESARLHNPTTAAIAQTSFDCWLQELEENIQPEHIALCRDDFDAAMDALMASDEDMFMEQMAMAMSAGPFMVYFGFNSAELDSSALALIEALASHEIAADENGEINITGHTDSSGSSDYNDDLALARVSAVGKALGDAGVAASIYMSSLGEDMLMVETGDGVREAKNRLVVIELSR